MSNCFSSLLITPISFAIHSFTSATLTKRNFPPHFCQVSKYSRSWKCFQDPWVFVYSVSFQKSPFTLYLLQLNSLLKSMLKCHPWPRQSAFLYTSNIVWLPRIFILASLLILSFTYDSSLLLHFLLFRDSLTKLAKLVLEVTCIWEHHHCDQICINHFWRSETNFVSAAKYSL